MRFRARLAAALFGAAALAGCSSTPDATKLAGSAAKSDDHGLGPAGKNLPTDLDGEIRRAQLMRSQGDLSGATSALSQMMLVAPDDPRVIGEYGKVLAQQGRAQDAVAFLSRAVEMQPNDFMLYSALGVAYDQLGDQAHAKFAYIHALALKPGEPSVLNNYAMSRMLAGDLPAARELIEQASSTGIVDAKIAHNRSLIESLAPTPAATPVASNTTRQVPETVAVARAPKPVAAVAVNAPKPSAIAPPVRTAAQAPVETSTSKAAPIIAVAPPRPLGPLATASVSKVALSNQVVMEEIPVDPKAGPVHQATKAPHRLAAKTSHKTAKVAADKAKPKPAPKTAAKKASEPPQLRMTADASKP